MKGEIFMTLRYLINNICIQGDVRISVWEGEEEKLIKEFYGVSDLKSLNLSGFKNMYVTYMFVGGDNMLHIELQSREDHLELSRR